MIGGKYMIHWLFWLCACQTCRGGKPF